MTKMCSTTISILTLTIVAASCLTSGENKNHTPGLINYLNNFTRGNCIIPLKKEAILNFPKALGKRFIFIV